MISPGLLTQLEIDIFFMEGATGVLRLAKSKHKKLNSEPFGLSMRFALPMKNDTLRTRHLWVIPALKCVWFTLADQWLCCPLKSLQYLHGSLYSKPSLLY